MSEHRATVEWQRNGFDFNYETYPRVHEMRFNDITVAGNAAPENTPPTVDCQKKYIVVRYVDEAVGVLDRTWISRVTLRPRVTFSGARPSDEEHRALHHRAHEKCFIANSVKTEVLIEPC